MTATCPAELPHCQQPPHELRRPCAMAALLLQHGGVYDRFQRGPCCHLACVGGAGACAAAGGGRAGVRQGVRWQS
eukprot:1153223-Pelagomonas_calceolata.AAC.5